MIAIKYEPVRLGLETAENVGNFATQQTLLANDLRQRQFNEEQARAQASFALQGVGQAFQQNLAVGDRNFRDEQAYAQDQRFQQQLASANQRAVLDSRTDYERARLMQEAANQRAAMGQQGQDYRLGQNLQSRAGLQDDRQQFTQDLQGQRFNQQQFLQDDRQGFTADQNVQRYQNQQAMQQAGFGNQRVMQDDRQQFATDQMGQSFENQQALQNQRLQAQRPGTDSRELQQWNAQRVHLADQYRFLQQQYQATLRQANARDKEGNFYPTAATAQQQLPSLQQQLQQAYDAVKNIGPAPQVQQQPGYQPLPPQQGQQVQPTVNDLDPTSGTMNAPPQAVMHNGRMYRLVGYDPNGQPLYE